MRLTQIIGCALPLLVAPALAATVCNGHSELCSKLYSGVTFIGTHNSYAVGTSLAENQIKDVTTQLTDGIRTLQAQVHQSADGLHVCHQSCALQDSGTLQNYLSTVNTWVSANPNEVISIVMVNIDNQPVTSFASAYQNAGLSQFAYSPPSAQVAFNAWPTLGSMIDSGKRVVVFIDNQANFGAVPWIMDEFSNMFEDAFDVTEQSFGCAANRTSGSPGQQLMLVNHFLDTVNTLGGTTFFLPDRTKLNETNSASGYGSIGAHVQNCVSIWGRNPNHILLDYYDSNGNTPFVLAAQLNSVSAPTNTIIPGSFDSASSASSSGGATRTNAGGSASATGSLAVQTSRLSAAGRGRVVGGLGLEGYITLSVVGVLGLGAGIGGIMW